MHSPRVTIVTTESIVAFQNSLSVKGRSENTVRAYGSDLRTFLQENPGEITAATFEQTALEWLNMYRFLKKPKTVNRRLTSLRAYARWGLINHPDLVDYSGPRTAKSQPHPIPEGVDGIRRMIGCAHFEYHAALIALMGLCGCRSSEALGVGPRDFDMSNMLLTIRGKGDVTRIVPVSPEAWDVLITPVARAFIADAPTVVGLKDRFARRLVTDLGQKAGLMRHVKSHDLRATFATAVYDKTKDMRLVQMLLGHANVNTTQIYVDVAEGLLRDAVVL